jgi:hypothetical protein
VAGGQRPAPGRLVRAGATFVNGKLVERPDDPTCIKLVHTAERDQQRMSVANGVAAPRSGR